MTEPEAMQKMETAISDLAKEAQTNDVIRGSHSGTLKVAAAPGLDARRLVELARDRLTFARNKLNDIRREHTMKQFEIDAEYQQKIEQAKREREQALVSLDQQTAEAARPAREMIELVEKMLG